MLRVEDIKPNKQLSNPNPSYQGISFHDYGGGGYKNVSPEQQRAWEVESGYNNWATKSTGLPNPYSFSSNMLPTLPNHDLIKRLPKPKLDYSKTQQYTKSSV